MKTRQKTAYIAVIASVMAVVGLFAAKAAACPPPPCPPCHSGAQPNCTWNCSTGQTCCNGACCTGTCCNNACCSPTNCKACVNNQCKSTCNTGNCETCINNACKVCDDDPNQVCCAGSCCDTSVNCKTCVNESCLPCGGDPNLLCCDGKTCYNKNEKQCCQYGDGTSCKKSCCNSWDCEYCDGSGCSPCLRKAANYQELMQCSRVPDPDYTPSPNGCGPEGGPSVPDNPTGCSDTSFLGACNAHDICYGTCNSSRAVCDNDFLNAMLEVCMWSSCAYRCSQFAYAYYGTVNNWGQAAYESAQVNACACCDCN